MGMIFFEQLITSSFAKKMTNDPLKKINMK